MKRSVVFFEPKGTVLEVVRAAKKAGFRVSALCSDPTLLATSPEPYRSAVPLIDEVIPVKTWNNLEPLRAACAAIHARTPIAGIYSGMDPCAVALAHLRQEYGLPTHRPEDIEIVLDKHELRQHLREAGLSRLQNHHGRDVDTWTSWRFSTPAYFKPVHGFFSAYVRRCESFDDLRAAQAEWREGNSADPSYVRAYLRSKDEYHLEEAIDGELLSVEALVTNGSFRALGLLSRILYSKNPVVEMGSCFPYPHPHAEKVISLVEAAHKALGLTDGPTHTEVIVDRTGHVEIIDLNPRFVGADVLQSINHALGVKIEEALLDYALGNQPKINPVAGNYSCLQYFLPPNVPRLNALAFPDAPEVKFTSSFIELGSSISSVNRQLDYLGCYLTVMPTFDAAIARSHELRTNVRINGSHQGVF